MKVAIIGAGTISANHIKAYREAGVEVVAICDRRRESAEARAAEFGIPMACADTEALFADPAIDAVSVATPVSTHKELVLSALRAGKHVFCEKPPAMTADDVREMIAARDGAGKVLQFGFVTRFKERTQEVRRAVADGLLGKPLFCEAGRLARLANPGGWFADRRFTRGGALFDAAIHEIDCLLYILGYPRIVSVRAFLGYENAGLSAQHGGSYRSATAGSTEFHNDVETSATVFCVTEDGLPILLRATAATGTVSQGPYVRLTGSNGGVEIGKLGEGATLVSLSDAGFVESETVAGGDSFTAQMRHFADCCGGRAVCDANAEQALSLMMLYDAIYRSGESGCEVRL